MLASALLTDNLEHGHGCLDESDYHAMNDVIKQHRKDLVSCRARIDAERAERPSLAGVKMPPRGGDDIEWEWANFWMPPRMGL